MREVSIREARQHISQLLKTVEAGEEVIIQKRGHSIAKLSPIKHASTGFPDRSELRNKIPTAKRSIADEIRELRDSENY